MPHDYTEVIIYASLPLTEAQMGKLVMDALNPGKPVIIRWQPSITREQAEGLKPWAVDNESNWNRS
jgi:hypothetical protein